MNFFKTGEHHFWACQIIKTEVVSSSSLQLTCDNTPASSSLMMETWGHTVMPKPIFRQVRMLVVLENFRNRGEMFCCSSDRPNARL
jgi:hypothetical protein